MPRGRPKKIKSVVESQPVDARTEEQKLAQANSAVVSAAELVTMIANEAIPSDLNPEPPKPVELSQNDPLLEVFINDRIVERCPVPSLGMVEAPNIITDSVKTILRRNRNGMYEGLNYHYNEYGRVDWQRMFNPRYFFYPNGDKGREPLLKVDGLKDLAEIRGIERKLVTIIPVSDNLVTCKVNIRFIANTDDLYGREWEATADASPHNIGGKMFSKFLTAMAETRATGRCIKEALGIRLATFEEMSGDDVQDGSENEKPVSDELIAAITRQTEIKGVKQDELMAKIKEKLPNIDNLRQINMEQGRVVLTWLNEKQNK